MVDELGDGGFALGQALDDAEPIDVGQGLVELADVTQLVGRVDDGRDRGADAGG